MRHRYLLACLVLSGSSGLAYELLWTRLLSLSFGSTFLSFSTVIAVFFGGLALGAYLAGKRAARVARPIRAYALIELATGAFGLLLYPLLARLESVFAAIDPGSGTGAALVRLAISVPLLLVPTVLMGATLPVITRAMIVSDADVGRGTALIYGFNTLGAFLGAYLTTYWVLPGLGIFHSLLLAAMGSFLAGAAALIAESAFGGAGASPSLRTPDPSDSTPEDDAPALPPGARKTLLVTTALAFLGGFAAIAFQVVWVRIFSIFLEGTVYGVGAVLICVLIGIAAGSLFIARILGSASHAPMWFAALQLLTIVAVLMISQNLLWIGYELRALGFSKTGGSGTLHAQLVVTFLILAVPTFCSGAAFPILVRIAESRAENASRALGSLYAANTAGSILGSLLTGFLIIPASGSEAAVLVAITTTALIAATGAALLFTGAWRALGLAVAAASLFSVTLYDGLDVRRVAAAVPERTIFPEYVKTAEQRVRNLAYFAEGQAATVAVFATESARSLNMNGLGQGARALPPPHHVLESLLVALVPLVHVEKPERGLVVGLGAGASVELLHALGVAHVEVLELEPKVLDAVRVIYPEKSPLEEPGVEAEVGDARHRLLLARAKAGDKYDLITSMPAHPWVAASIFTREFFELARDNLSERGVFCTWFGLLKMDSAAAQSLLRAFAEVFPNYIVYHVREVGSYYLVGSKQPLAIDLARARALIAHPDVSEHRGLEDPYYLLERIYASADAQTPQPPPGMVNTDDSAFVEVHAPRSSTVPPALHDFMPAEYLLPSLVPEGRRPEILAELLERILATPGGRLPNHPLGEVDARKARRSFEAFRASFSAEEAGYFEARLLLAEGRREAARELFDRTGRERGIFAARARKFLALTYERASKERIAALDALEPETDVLLALLESDVERARARIPRGAAVNAEEDPFRWLLARGMQLGGGALSDADRSAFAEHVGPALARSRGIELLRFCEDFARAHGLVHEAADCEGWRKTEEHARARELFRRGAQEATRGRFQNAASLLERADALEPGNRATIELLLRARVEIGDAEGVERLSRELLFQGRSRRYVEYLVRQAQAGKLASKVIESATASTSGALFQGGATESAPETVDTAEPLEPDQPLSPEGAR